MYESDQNQLISLLKEQNQLLRTLVSQNQSKKLGLCDRPPGRPQWIFVGRNGDSCWYTLSKDSQQVPIHQGCIVGKIVDIRFEEATRRGQSTHKLNILVDCGESKYIIQTGNSTCFAKSFLASLAIASSMQLAQPITIAVRPGDDDAVVWCGLYAPEYIKAPGGSKRNP